MHLRRYEKKESLLVNLQKEFHVHFVCTGNAYRSRLAEAYLKAKQLPWLHISSSGTAAEYHFRWNGPICWWVMRLIYNDRLVPCIEVVNHAENGTEDLLADLISIISSFCARLYGQRRAKRKDEPLEVDIALIKFTEHTFKQIREKVDFFIEDLKRSIEC